MTEERNEDMISVSFASEAEEIAYLRKRVAALESDKISLERDKGSLEKEKKNLEQENVSLLQQLDYWKKRFFGRMSEKKHLPLDPNQLSLFSAEDLAQMSPEEKEGLEAEAQKQEETITKTVTVRRQPKRRNLDTTGLMVMENHLYPEGCTDSEGKLLESFVEIGTETSDRLEMVAPKLYVERTIRHKVISREDMARNAEDRTIMIAPLPPMPIEHGMAGASLLADIILGKFLYHLPFYRQINRFREFGLRLPASTIGDWYEKSVESLNVLYELLRKQVMASEYIQVDESVVPVLDNEKHKARKGYEWCVRDGLTGSLFFWYDRGSRSKKTARELLGGYRGTFQSDGYEAYEQFCDTPGVQGAACWAHARRKFVDALKEDQKLATQAIVMIGKLYEVERKADEAGMTAEQRRELRQKEAYPVIQLMERWCLDTYATVLESSLMGKAIAYTYSLMDRLAIYVNDGSINIDNNLIENAIRPLALGRKNWLFCGNDASAYRASIVYSLLASCRAADVDPRQWLEHVLVEIPSRRKTGQSMEDLLPMEYAKSPDTRPWNLPDPD